MKQHQLEHKLPHSIVFYDHRCGVCCIEMAKLKKHDHLEHLLLIDISTPEFNPLLWGIELSSANEQLHVRSPAGNWLTGITAIRHIYGEIGLGWVWWFTKLPVISYVSQHAYRWFARNRMDISKTLGLNSQSKPMCKSCVSKNSEIKGD